MAQVTRLAEGNGLCGRGWQNTPAASASDRSFWNHFSLGKGDHAQVRKDLTQLQNQRRFLAPLSQLAGQEHRTPVPACPAGQRLPSTGKLSRVLLDACLTHTHAPLCSGHGHGHGRCHPGLLGAPGPRWETICCDCRSGGGVARFQGPTGHICPSRENQQPVAHQGGWKWATAMVGDLTEPATPRPRPEQSHPFPSPQAPGCSRPRCLKFFFWTFLSLLFTVGIFQYYSPTTAENPLLARSHPLDVPQRRGNGPEFPHGMFPATLGDTSALPSARHTCTLHSRP